MVSTGELLRAISRHDRAAFIIAIDPRAADALIPKYTGHRFAQHRAAAHRIAELNPQPLPPLEIGAALLGEVLQRATLGAVHDGPEGVAKLVSRDLDDWCGTGYPGWWLKRKKGGFVLGGILGRIGLAGGESEYKPNPDDPDDDGPFGPFGPLGPWIHRELGGWNDALATVAGPGLSGPVIGGPDTPFVRQGLLLGAALAAATLAGDLEAGPVADALEAGAERLVEAAFAH